MRYLLLLLILVLFGCSEEPQFKEGEYTVKIYVEHGNKACGGRLGYTVPHDDDNFAVVCLRGDDDDRLFIWEDEMTHVKDMISGKPHNEAHRF